MYQSISDVHLYRAMRGTRSAKRGSIPSPSSPSLLTWIVWIVLFLIGLALAHLLIGDPGASLLSLPYWIHMPGTPATEGTRCASKQEAYEGSKEVPGSVVTFELSEEEQHKWKRREYDRFADGTYSLPPWIPIRSNCWEPRDGPDVREFLQEPYKTAYIHFAHLSLKHPGQIAYTPSDDHGYADRQVVLKPGKYLEQYFSEVFTREQIAGYVDGVKAYTGDLQITRDPLEIRSIYTGGPRSCMSRITARYVSAPVHPSEAYGNSPDLALAYLGTLDHATARCVIRPDDKIYSRIYGDTTLAQILRLNGFKEGSLSGARLRAIKHDEGIYVMPYVDGTGSASLSSDKQFLILHEDESGEYPTHVTCENGGDTLCAGVTEYDEDEDEDRHHTCAHCERECDPDETYCYSCDQDRYYCDGCDEDQFDGEGHCVGDRVLCPSCYRVSSNTCDECGDRFHEEEIRSHDRVEEGDPRGEYCGSCRHHIAICEHCVSTFDTNGETKDPTGRRCDECTPDPDEDEDEDTSGDPAASDTSSLGYPRIFSTVALTRFDGDFLVEMPILYLAGALAVHRADPSSSYRFTLTHIPTGLQVRGFNDYEIATRIADRLTLPGVYWGFTDRIIPPDTLNHYVSVLRAEGL